MEGLAWAAIFIFVVLLGMIHNELKEISKGLKEIRTELKRHLVPTSDSSFKEENLYDLLYDTRRIMKKYVNLKLYGTDT